MAKYRLWVMTNYVGSKCEEIIDIPDEDVPENEFDPDFERNMFSDLSNMGMFEWGYERIEE